MKTLLLQLAASMAWLGIPVAVACGQTNAPVAEVVPTPKPSSWTEWSERVKNPTDWFSWGADLRLRNEYFNNALTLSQNGPRNEQDYFRYRGRVWMSFIPVTNVTLNVRLTAEPRTFLLPSFCATHGYQTGTEWRYGIFDSLMVKWVDAFDLPMVISVGRQDVQFGEPGNWWLVGDGSPFDGSWTMFFDSARVTYQARQLHTRIDAVYLLQYANPGQWLPTIGKSWDNTVNGVQTPYYLTEQNEQGMILHAANTTIENMEIDGYFIFKHDEEVSLIPYGDNANTYTLGARVSGAPAVHWTYSAEGAYQFGEKQDPTVLPAYTTAPGAWRDISAYGGNLALKYLFQDRLNNQLSLAAELLSGDKPGTKGTDEMFNILWGRYPRYSEISFFSYANETSRKVAQLNNLARIGPSWSLSPVKDLTFKLTYNALFAPQSIPTRNQNPTLFSYDGNFRGHFLQSWLKYQFNKNISGHLWGEFQWEGNYYGQRDLMTFLRAEVVFTF